MTDLAIVNGTVFGSQGASGVAIDGGRITAVGGNEVARGARETVDARGGLVLPGFDDAHIHLLSGAREANGALLYPLETVEEIQDRIRAHAAAERALAAGIAAAIPGNRVGDISAAIGDIINDAGYAVNTSFGGHGVGHTMHQAPDVPNWGEPGRGLQLRAGLVIAIEPWFLAGDGSIRMDKDGWTIRSGDRTRGVHVEHTVVITADGPIVLTDRSGLTPGS